MQESRILMIGPSKSGKTCLLGAAELSAAQCMFGGPRCRVVPKNDNMVNLVRNFRSMIKTGKLTEAINADTKTVQYEFEFDAETTADETLGRGSAPPSKTFIFLDGPGGALIPSKSADLEDEAIQHFRQELMQHGRQSQSLLLCVDSHDEHVAMLFLEFIPELLAEFTEHQLPFDRVAIVLTKCDAHFMNMRRYAEGEAQDDPWRRAFDMVTPAGLGVLLSRLKKHTQIGCGWASAYGFIANEGTANFNPHTGGLRTYHPDYSDVDRIRSWRPFRVLDPFIFLATGHAAGLHVFNVEQLLSRLATYHNSV